MAAAAAAGSGRSAEQLAQLVAAKEAELAGMFVSGRIPKVRPSGGVLLLRPPLLALSPQQSVCGGCKPASGRPGSPRRALPPCTRITASQAATVAAVRKELSDLRAELSGQLGIGRPGAPAAAAPAPGYPSAPTSILDTSSSSSTAASNGRVLNALKLVEAQLAASRGGADGAGVSLGGLSLEQQQQLLQLQEENTQLKCAAGRG